MRIRTVKPEFWANEKMSSLPDFTRLLALGLLNYSDDHGYFWANPLLVRGALFPFDEDSSKVRRGLAQLASEGYVRLGKTVDGRECGHVVNFSKHQRVDKPRPSDIQPLIVFDDASKNDRRSIQDESSLDRKGMEGKGVAPKAPPSAARNDLLDALAKAEGTPLNQMTPAVCARLGMALKEIKAATPEVTASEIAKRAINWRSHFPDAAFTATALAKWWGRCERANNGMAQDKPRITENLVGLGIT